MSLPDWATVLCFMVGAIFFLAGTVGILRFPDLFCRLHALTKADNLGLGFLVLGLLFQAASVAAAFKLILIWLLALMASSNACYAIGRFVLERSGNQGKSAVRNDET